MRYRLVRLDKMERIILVVVLRIGRSRGIRRYCNNLGRVDWWFGLGWV